MFGRRWLLVPAIVVSIAAGGGGESVTDKDKRALQGHWLVVMAEIDGDRERLAPDVVHDAHLELRGDLMILRWRSQEVVAHYELSESKGSFRWIDLKGRDTDGAPFVLKGIYKLQDQNRSFHVCLTLTSYKEYGPRYARERPIKMETRSYSASMLAVLKRDPSH
jgi:uncharacterized protein (TIGR03067 family)